MVNVEKHKRKAIEHDFNKFIDTISGNRRSLKNKIKNRRRNLYKKSVELDSVTKPKLASSMNMNHFRRQLKQEQDLRRSIFKEL